MKTQKKVLIALDYNPTAQKVAEEGYSVASAMNAEVYLLHVLYDQPYYFAEEYSPIMGFTGYMEMGAVTLQGNEALVEASKQYLMKTREHLKDAKIKILVKEGIDLAETIIHTTEEINADIIVAGSLSRKWLENIILGSVTEKLLHQSNIPLFVIPTKSNA